jgi:hypothetical protein
MPCHLAVSAPHYLSAPSYTSRRACHLVDHLSAPSYRSRRALPSRRLRPSPSRAPALCLSSAPSPSVPSAPVLLVADGSGISRNRRAVLFRDGADMRFVRRTFKNPQSSECACAATAPPPATAALSLFAFGASRRLLSRPVSLARLLSLLSHTKYGSAFNGAWPLFGFARNAPAAAAAIR